MDAWWMHACLVSRIDPSVSYQFASALCRADTRRRCEATVFVTTETFESSPHVSSFDRLSPAGHVCSVRAAVLRIRH